MTTADIRLALAKYTRKRTSFFRSLSNDQLSALAVKARKASANMNAEPAEQCREALVAELLTAYRDGRSGIFCDRSELVAQLEHYQQLFRTSLTA